ncbi:MAG: hypothetical protein DCC75_11085 [Proteobacteria bacterium]|nr:MAG: hypothetical protein DCC75_11085 [Pseudomonadota bacterium]
MSKIAQLKKEASLTSLFDAKGQTDTLRLWENYRDQALMWRALALFQIPTTFIIALLSVLLWVTRSITLNVPAKPLPGVYLAQEVPDTEFIEAATDYINLTASYQPNVARRQFIQAREMLKEPMLERFNLEMMAVELKAIENTNRTQIFFADPTKTRLDRISDQEVLVTFIGERLTIVAGKELEPAKTKFSVTMTTVPRQRLNPYGIVITGVTFENLERDRPVYRKE